MNKNSIKDDELEKVNGGTWEENDELNLALHTPGANIGFLKSFLDKHGIYAELHDSQFTDNIYVNKETNERLTHEQLIELIEKNQWYM